MNKSSLVLPAILGLALAVSACAKHDDLQGNNVTSDVTLNEEDATGGNLAATDDPIVDNAAGQDNLSVDGGAPTLDNGH